MAPSGHSAYTIVAPSQEELTKLISFFTAQELNHRFLVARAHHLLRPWTSDSTAFHVGFPGLHNAAFLARAIRGRGDETEEIEIFPIDSKTVMVS